MIKNWNQKSNCEFYRRMVDLMENDEKKMLENGFLPFGMTSFCIFVLERRILKCSKH